MKKTARKSRPKNISNKRARRAKSRDHRVLARDPKEREQARERSLANLKHGEKFRWRPGVSGNPTGRPAYKKLSEACRQLLASPFPDDPTRTWAEAIAEKLGYQALAGVVGAASELADRSEGRAAVSVAVQTEDDPITLLIEGMHEMSKRLGRPEGWSPRNEPSDEQQPALLPESTE